MDPHGLVLGAGPLLRLELLPQAQASGVVLPAELGNLHQLKVVFETLGDYHLDDEQPSYVMAVPCRPVVVALSALIPGLPAWQRVDWAALQVCGPLGAPSGVGLSLIHI